MKSIFVMIVAWFSVLIPASKGNSSSFCTTGAAHDDIIEAAAAAATVEEGSHWRWTTDEIIHALEQSDFAVGGGSYVPGNAQTAYDTGLMADADGNNAGHPYNLATVPPLQGEAPSALSILVQNNTIENVAFRMRPDEGIVFTGRTPPKIDYFSFRSYLFYRFVAEESRIEKQFNSLGDTLNKQRNFKHILPDEPFVFISVASKATLHRIKTALNGIVPENRILVDKIPLGLVNLGTNLLSDQIGILARFGNPKNQSALKAYSLNLLGRSGTFLRATPNVETKIIPKVHQFPYSIISRDTDGGRNPESYEINKYYNGFQKLRRGILETWMDMGYNPTEYKSSIWLAEGIDGIQRGVDLLGEDRDTAYIRSEDFTLGLNEIAIVYGVHHTNVSSSVYNSLSVYDPKILSGVIGINSYNSSFPGGAEQYLKNHPLVDSQNYHYYVWHLKRGGSSSMKNYTLTVPSQLHYQPLLREPEEGRHALMNRAERILLDSKMFLGWRAYVNPETGVGPSWNEIIYDRVIKFTPSGQGGSKST